MFDRFFKAVKTFFTSEPLKIQFEEMVFQEAVKEKAAKPVDEVVVIPAVIATVEVAPVVTDQITDAATQEAPANPKRARTAKGKLKADDKSTPEVNEAWEGGVAPAKKPRATKKKKAD